MLARGSEGMVLFRRLAARAKRFALSRHSKHEKYKNTTTHGASEPNDTIQEVTKRTRLFKLCTIHATINLY